MKSNENIILIGLLIFFFLVLTSSIIKNSDEKMSNVENSLITKITDGDTVIVKGGERVRLLGIDCDERGKACYSVAKNYLEENFLGKEVILEKENEDEDIYGRKLRWIFVEGENLNKKLVEEGYCVARFDQDSKYKDEVRVAEEFAIENKVGCKW